MNFISLEKEVKQFLKDQNIHYHDRTTSFKDLDFTILLGNKPYFYLEVKEKRQQYNMKHWPSFTQEKNLFILDDLTARKCLALAPQSGILVRDNVKEKERSHYYFFSVIDLALMPKLRVNRQIKKEINALKGKWLINFKNGLHSTNLKEMFAHITKYKQRLNKILFSQLECYGHYVDEKILISGSIRNPSHWKIDVRSSK